MYLKKTKIEHTKWEKDVSGIEVLHVDKPHALIQAAGYLKYTRSEMKEGIFFRGQRKIYGSLKPCLFRGINRNAAQYKRVEKLNKVVKKFAREVVIFEGVDEMAYEPLLQHYGINTTWVDLVDNVWIALWFACHKAMCKQKIQKFLHFEERIPSEKEKFAYILLVAADLEHMDKRNCNAGCIIGRNTELIDLRMAVPSIFVRPHAQHALLFRMRGTDSGRRLDYKDQLRGIIRVKLRDALAWLGNGALAGTHTLFPPAYYDYGYEILLGIRGIDTKFVGGINHIGS
ncbi:FRG domain-containing protein [Desulfobaculum senezii]